MQLTVQKIYLFHLVILPKFNQFILKSQNIVKVIDNFLIVTIIAFIVLLVFIVFKFGGTGEGVGANLGDAQK